MSYKYFDDDIKMGIDVFWMTYKEPYDHIHLQLSFNGGGAFLPHVRLKHHKIHWTDTTIRKIILFKQSATSYAI